jgi:hypothetical protein
MKTATKSLFSALAALTLLAGLAGAQSDGYSGDAVVDTRSLSRVEAAEGDALDTRSYASDWSAPLELDTRKPLGTMLLLK